MVFCGTDIVEIARIERCLRNPRFLLRFFSKDEQELVLSRPEKRRAETVAAGFAAKEAFAKALGTGFRNFSLKEIGVLRSENGRPFLKLSGGAKKAAEEKMLCFDVSLSHCSKFAVAVVVGSIPAKNELPKI